MDNIKDIIKNVIDDISYKKVDENNSLFLAWEESLSRKELEHTKIIGEKDGFLSVYVDSPAWMYQMKLIKKTIIKKMKAKGVTIKGIYFKLGKIK